MKSVMGFFLAAAFIFSACGGSETRKNHDSLSAAGKVEAKDAEFTGTLIGLYAIGGETTGTGLRLADGNIVELDLRTNSLQGIFAEDKVVTVRGYFKTIYGVEIKERQILVVTEVIEQGQSQQHSLTCKDVSEGISFVMSLPPQGVKTSQGTLTIHKQEKTMQCERARVQVGGPIIFDAPSPLWSCIENRGGEGRFRLDIHTQGFSAMILGDLEIEQIFPLAPKPILTMVCEG